MSKFHATSSSSSNFLDFDEEARALFIRLNIDPATKSSQHWSSLDPIFRHGGGGTIYVGNQTAAESLSILTAKGITGVVNCTHGTSAIPNFHPKALQYYEFPIR